MVDKIIIAIEGYEKPNDLRALLRKAVKGTWWQFAPFTALGKNKLNSMAIHLSHVGRLLFTSQPIIVTHNLLWVIYDPEVEKYFSTSPADKVDYHAYRRNLLAYLQTRYLLQALIVNPVQPTETILEDFRSLDFSLMETSLKMPTVADTEIISAIDPMTAVTEHLHLAKQVIRDLEKNWTQRLR